MDWAFILNKIIGAQLKEQETSPSANPPKELLMVSNTGYFAW